MLKSILIIFIILLILLFPFEIKIYLKYIDNSLHIYLFSKELDLKKLKPKKEASKKKDSKKKLEFKYNDFTNLIYKIDKNPYKPKLKFLVSGESGFEEAAFTAQFCGISNAISPFLFIVLKKVFNMYKFKFNLTPNFNEKSFKIEIKSIILINFANIICISIIIFLWYLIIVIKNRKSKLITKEAA